MSDDVPADVEAIYAQFVIDKAYRTLVAVKERMARWVAADEQLGYSTDTEWFTEVGASLVPSDLVAAVDAAVALCVGLLGIGRPRVRWFLPETPQEAAFRADRGPVDLDQFPGPARLSGLADRAGETIWVHAGLSLRQAMRTAAHEVRHLTQQFPSGPDEYVDNEIDARTFAEQFARAYDLN